MDDGQRESAEQEGGGEDGVRENRGATQRRERSEDEAREEGDGAALLCLIQS